MPQTVNLFLPLDVNIGHLLGALTRLVGGPMEKMPFGSKPSNTDLPPGPDNPWSPQFPEARARAIEGGGFEDLSMVRLEFKDALLQSYSWNFHMLSDAQDARQLTPNSHAIGVALAYRLVHLFGGRLEEEGGKLAPIKVARSCAQFPRRSKKETNDEWFFRTQQTLASIEPITRAQLEWAEQHSYYGMDERARALLPVIEMLALERSTPTSSPSRPGPRL